MNAMPAHPSPSAPVAVSARRESIILLKKKVGLVGRDLSARVVGEGGSGERRRAEAG
jgi:hypothetical protein